jgi:peptide/nickel transport system substrate-binding protein
VEVGTMTEERRPPLSPSDLVGSVSRRGVLKAGGILAGVTLIPGLLSSCTSDSSSVSPAATGPLDTEGANIFEALDPHIASAIGTIAITDLIFESLYSTDPVNPAQVVPVLADGDPQVSGRTATVRLRQGAIFHDGTPVRAADVVFSFKRIADPKLASLYARFLSFITKVEAPDDTTVRFTMATTSSLLKNRLGLVRIMSEKQVRKADKKALATRPIGSGPFRATAVNSTRTVTLEKSALYRGPRKGVADKITYAVVPDDAARLSALASGQTNVIYDVPYQDVDRLNAGATKSAAVPSFDHTDVFFNCKKAPFDDPRVRLAFHHAVNRQAILDAVYLGRAENAVSILPSRHPDFVEPTTKVDYDPARARQLLSEAGVSQLSMTLLVSNIGYVTPQATLIQGDLEKVGISAKVQPGETQSLLPKILDGKYDAWLTIGNATVVGAYDGEFLMRWLYYGAIATSFMYWSTPEQKKVEALLETAFSAPAERGRKDALAQVQNIVAAAVPTFPLHFRQLPSAWSSQRNLRPSPVYGVDLFGAAS